MVIDTTGKYTYTGSRGNSLVDYVITTTHLFSHVEYFDIHDPNILSDHCLVDFSFSFIQRSCNSNDRTVECSEPQRVTDKYVWDSCKQNEYISGLNLAIDNLNQLGDGINECCSSSDIDNCITELSNILDDVVSPLFKRHCKVKVTDKQANAESSQPWFKLECYEKRKLFYRTLNEYRNNNSEENRSNMVSVKSQYKQCLRSNRYQYDKK